MSIYLWILRSKKKPNVHEWYSTALERVVGKTFINQVVEIDNKAFEHCKFVNARIMFHGLGPCKFEKCDFGAGVLLIDTDNAAAMCMMMLQNLGSGSV